MVSRGSWPGAVALALLGPGCTLPPFDAAGKSCSSNEPCPSPFVCVLQGTAGVCSKDPCAGSPLLGLPCDAGLGICLRTGTYVCSAQPGTVTATPVRCDAVPGPPDAEVCNGLDDDCDGVIDNHPAGAPACELDAGVCAGARHACIDGGFESVCTAVSYGPLYQPVETLCDGLDNDCDGRVDVSRALPVASGASAFAWGNDGKGFEVLVEKGGAIYRSRFDLEFNLLAGPARISSAGLSARWPAIAAGGAQAVALWVEDVGDGGQRVWLAQVSDAGSVSWAGAPGGVAAPAGVYLPPSLALDATGTTAVVAWIVDGGAQVMSWTVPLARRVPPPPRPASGFPPPNPFGDVNVAAVPDGGDGGSFYDVTAMPQTFTLSFPIVRYDLSGNVVCQPPINLGGMGGPVSTAHPLLANGLAVYEEISPPQSKALMAFAYDCSSFTEPEVVAPAEVENAMGGALAGGSAAWRAPDGGIWAAVFNGSAVGAPVLAFPGGFQTPVLTWGGAPYMSLAASVDGGVWGEHVCGVHP
jgi:hypothetical protein